MSDQEQLLSLKHHAVTVTVDVDPCPLNGKQRSFEELLIRVLLADILAGEAFLRELLRKEIVSRYELLFCVSGEEHERLALRRKVSHMIFTITWADTR